MKRPIVCAAVVFPLLAGASAIPVGAAIAAPRVGASTASTDSVTMDYEMNESAGARVMGDSGPLGLNGTIGTEVQTGYSVSGAVGYQFPRLTPNKPPAHPEHLVAIPNSDALNPQSSPYSIEIRYRTTNKFGNLIQKGQSTTKGGQIKIQLPKGHPSCYYKGSAGRVGAGWTTPINDGQWHTLLCTLDGTGVKLYVDGVLRGKKTGSPGVIDNTYPVTIGGKPNCDQIKVTCDYFGGTVDYLKITKG